MTGRQVLCPHAGTNPEKHPQNLMPIRIAGLTGRSPHPLLVRTLGIVLAAAILIPALFFVLFLLAFAGVVALGIVLRLLWTARKHRAPATPDVIEGEYSVLPQENRVTEKRVDTTHER